MKGRGTPGLNGGPPGDLYVVVHVAPHPIFGRSGKRDLTVKVPITFPEAALGAQVKVPTLDVAGHREGARRARRPARPSACAGAGIQRGSGDPGALLVTFDVVVPTELDDDAQRGGRGARRASCPATHASTWGCEHGRATTATARSTSSRSPRSWPACTRRPCASTSARASSSRAAPRGAAGATPTATSRCSSASRSSPTRASAWPGSASPRARGRARREVRIEGAGLESELAQAAEISSRAVRRRAPPYRRDLVPVSAAGRSSRQGPRLRRRVDRLRTPPVTGCLRRNKLDSDVVNFGESFSHTLR